MNCKLCDGPVKDHKLVIQTANEDIEFCSLCGQRIFQALAAQLCNGMNIYIKKIVLEYRTR